MSQTSGVAAPAGSERDPALVCRRRRLAAAAAAAVVLVVLGLLALLVTIEVNDRRRQGFCRPDHGIAGATGYEERSWWPVGERCYLRLADGTVRVRRPGWALTALVAAWPVAAVAGATGPPRSARRRLAWTLAVPGAVVAALVLALVQPRSLARLVSLTTISLGFGAVGGAVTAAGAWYVLRGRVMATVLGSWLAWAVIVFLQGRDAIGP